MAACAVHTVNSLSLPATVIMATKVSSCDTRVCRHCLVVGTEPLVTPCSPCGALAHASCEAQLFSERARWWCLSCEVCGHDYEGALALTLGKLALRAMEAEVDPEEDLDMQLKRAAALENLGAACAKMGNNLETRDFLQRALALKDEALGPNHPDVAVAMVNLSDALKHLGRYAEQQCLLEKAVKIQKSSRGLSSTSDIARMQANLGNCHGAQGEFSRQRGFLESALELLEKENGIDSPEIADLLTDLGNAYSCLGYSAKQRDVLERAVVIQEAIYGADHRVVATIKYNLAHALNTCGEPDRAVDLMGKTVVQLTNCYGSEHRHTRSARSAVQLWSRPACRPRQKPWRMMDERGVV